MIDRVAAGLGRQLVEVPVGFKWFVDGLVDGSLGFGGEESAGASFLRRNGSGVDNGQRRHRTGAACRRDDRSDRLRPRRGLSPAHTALRRSVVPTRRRTRDTGAEDSSSLTYRRRRSDRTNSPATQIERVSDARTVPGRTVRRRQGRYGSRLVRRAPIGHRGHLQDLRRELPRRRASAAHRGRSTGDRRRRAWRMTP